MKTYIGIDWGSSKIGTSYADDETRIAFRGGFFENDEMLFDKLSALCDQHDSCMFVVGNTTHDQQNDNAEHIEKFCESLSKKSGREIVSTEEMFTSREAQKNLIAAGKDDVSHMDDMEAARILLQSYLDHLKK